MNFAEVMAEKITPDFHGKVTITFQRGEPVHMDVHQQFLLKGGEVIEKQEKS
jgi:hypothetical protein